MKKKPLNHFNDSKEPIELGWAHVTIRKDMDIKPNLYHINNVDLVPKKAYRKRGSNVLYCYNTGGMLIDYTFFIDEKECRDSLAEHLSLIYKLINAYIKNLQEKKSNIELYMNARPEDFL